MQSQTTPEKRGSKILKALGGPNKQPLLGSHACSLGVGVYEMKTRVTHSPLTPKETKAANSSSWDGRGQSHRWHKPASQSQIFATQLPPRPHPNHSVGAANFIASKS